MKFEITATSLQRIKERNMKIYPESNQVSATIKHIVDYMIKHGTENTTSGNYIFTVNELSEIFMLDSSFIIRHEEDILDELYSRNEILGEIWMDRDSDFNVELFDLNFGTDYCPNLDDEPLTPEEFAEEMGCIHMLHVDDIELCHRFMDDSMTDLLTSLGYGKGVEIFRTTNKWYA